MSEPQFDAIQSKDGSLEPIQLTWLLLLAFVWQSESFVEKKTHTPRMHSKLLCMRHPAKLQLLAGTHSTPRHWDVRNHLRQTDVAGNNGAPGTGQKPSTEKFEPCMSKGKQATGPTNGLSMSSATAICKLDCQSLAQKNQSPVHSKNLIWIAGCWHSGMPLPVQLPSLGTAMHVHGCECN